MFSNIGEGSIHVQSWPQAKESLIDADVENSGEFIKDVASAVRRYKSEKGMALNARLEKIELYGVDMDITDLIGVTNSPVEVIAGKPDFEHVPVNVKPNMGKIGPVFRGKAKAIIDALLEENPKKIADDISKGKISVSVNGEVIELEPDFVEVEKEVVSAGRSVDVLDVSGMPVVIVR
jgi:valyl-tRNA synthetase